MTAWHETKEGTIDWRTACQRIRRKVHGLEAHQRIEVYRVARNGGLCHWDALDKAMNTANSDLPHIVFEKA